MPTASPLLAAALALGTIPTATAGPDDPTPLRLRVAAGRHDRLDTPVSARLEPADLPASTLRRLGESSGRIVLREVRDGDARGPAVVAQIDRAGDPDGPPRIVWVMPGPLKAGESRTFVEEVGDEAVGPGPWSFATTPGGHLALRHRGDPVFRYNANPVSDPGHPDPNQPRDAYIHPASTPSGHVITGDYSDESHPHQRGFFLAYPKTEVGALRPDFWNIQAGTGKIRSDGFGEVSAGPVTARFRARHVWEAILPDGGRRPVLDETWDVEAVDIPGRPYWLFDLTSTQRAVDEPLRLPPYRYGGMAYRGPDSFFPEGVLDVVTSEGFGRSRGDQEPARWVDLAGPIADGSSTYAGAAIFDHPGNIHHPTSARINPRLPFFAFVPSNDRPVTIGAGRPATFRYRILIHDGRPDPELDERLWRDFAEPPTVSVESTDPAAFPATGAPVAH